MKQSLHIERFNKKWNKTTIKLSPKYKYVLRIHSADGTFQDVQQSNDQDKLNPWAKKFDHLNRTSSSIWINKGAK